ncbi:MAG TPA: hypothetical protein PKI61_03785 [bacterium]|nr:hypothetical protein [bacterium]HPT29877.1 hypothetical protein [bacterium]
MAFYFALIKKFDYWFWIPAFLIFLEIFIIIFNKWKCPITKIAGSYTQNRKANFDIYLPERVAQYSLKVYMVLIPLEILIILIRLSFWD